MATKPPDEKKTYWSDVAVAHQRALHSFDLLVQPVLDRFALSKLGAANVLFLLAVGKTRRRVSELVRFERYISSNASYAMSILADAGLLTKFTDLQDKRMRLVEATTKGRRLIDEIRAVSVGHPDIVAHAIETAGKMTEFVDSRLKPAPPRPPTDKADGEKADD